MPKSKVNKTTKRVCLTDDRSCKKQTNSRQKAVLDSLTGEKFVDQSNKLVDLTSQLAIKLKVSPSLQSKQKNATHDRTVADEIEEPAVSNSLKLVQNNAMCSAQLPSTSHFQVHQISSSCKSKAKSSIDQTIIQNVSKKEKGYSNRITTMSNNDEWMTKDLVTNLVDTHDKVKRQRSKKQAHETTAANESSMENVLREYNYNRKEIVNSNKKKTMGKPTTLKSKKGYSDYIPISEMNEILQNQKSDNIQYVKGNLRVNPLSRKYGGYAYLRMEESERDLLIAGPQNRNCTLDGDLVVACIKPDKDWHKFPDGKIQKTGKIVCILEKVHPRRAVGCLKRQNTLVILEPKDLKIPMIIIHPESIPTSYYTQPDLYKNTLFLASIDSWKQEKDAFGRILSIVGKEGELETELQTIIFENNLDVSPYDEALLKGLPSSDYVLTDTDVKGREDWRHECVFTIDPATAVDIDDAISCKVLDNGNYEIGVHISDVTHYLEFSSPLDEEVSKRATTIYLPHKAYHMLPEELTRICSLLAGKDRLAFSVIWEMTPDAEIVKHRFAKTVIRSCCQMSYDSAQALIENPEKSWPEDFLHIKGDYTMSSLSGMVNKLFKLAISLRDERFTGGALRMDQPKLQISMDATLRLESGIPMPVNYYLEKKRDSNSLIEEFMLLANITVATHLYAAIPETALLRIHKDPSKYNLNIVAATLQKFGIHLDIETAGALHTSIHRYDPEYNSAAVNNSMKYITMTILHMCSKTMIRAEYTCASTVPSSSNLRHYALNVPLYTHFTSPIRRYPDCIVHRLLYATIENKPLPEKWTAQLCSRLAANCNVKKHSAKLAQEQSTELFFAYMVGLAGGFEASATVTYVKEDGIDIILCDTGLKFRMDLKEIENSASLKYSVDYVPTLTIIWKNPPSEQVINLFSLVRVRIENISEELRLKATLLPPFPIISSRIVDGNL